jgi:MFS transporter, ACS family, tartrate transporter
MQWLRRFEDNCRTAIHEKIPRMLNSSDPHLQSATISRLMLRLMPFLFLLYIVAYLDRINVSFAILQMREPLQLSDQVYGRAAGIFFAGYFLFQLPSNLILHRVGVRRWISGLMIIWGLISCSMIFIRGPLSFYALRFALGAAEAGFFPGMILYIKHWFPLSARARAVALFMTANPLAGVIGSPISGALLGLHGGGLAGWQWLFLLEGIPAIVLGGVVLAVLVDTPAGARWLTQDEKSWLIDNLRKEQETLSTDADHGLRAAFTNYRVWIFSVIYFGLAACMYGVTLWLPTVIRSLTKFKDFEVGVVAAVPYIVAAVVMFLAGLHSDRSGERRWHTAIAAYAGATCLVVAAYAASPWLIIAGVGLSISGAQSMTGPFWAMATTRLGGAAAAVSIALINSIGNLGGYFGPYILGSVRSAGGAFAAGFLAIAGTLVLGGTLALIAGPDRGNAQAA